MNTALYFVPAIVGTATAAGLGIHYGLKERANRVEESKEIKDQENQEMNLNTTDPEAIVKREAQLKKELEDQQGQAVEEDRTKIEAEGAVKDQVVETVEKQEKDNPKVKRCLDNKSYGYWRYVSEDDPRIDGYHNGKPWIWSYCNSNKWEDVLKSELPRS